MKTIEITLLCLTIFLTGAANAQVSPFKINAMIQGVMTGDTLIFTRYEMPSWETLNSDTIIAIENEQFSYSKNLAESSYYIIEYYPSQGIPMVYCNRGFSFFARPGDQLKVNGNIKYFPAMHKEGGVYNDPRLKRILHLDDSLTTERNKIYRKLYACRSAYPDSISYSIW